MSRFQRFEIAARVPGALPQAVAFRTFGAVSAFASTCHSNSPDQTVGKHHLSKLTWEMKVIFEGWRPRN